MNCVRLYCDAAAGAPWYLEKKGERLRRMDEDQQDAPIGPIALYKLLDAPNPYQDYEELIQLLVIDLLLTGNAYWYKWRSNEQGQPLSLFRLAPPYVKIVPGDLGPKGYEYKVPDSGQRKPLEIKLPEMIHFKLPNPHDPYYGLGVIQGGTKPLDLELALTDHQTNYFQKGASPSLVVQSERRVPRDVLKKLQNQLRGRYGGSKNAGEMMVLEAGLRAESLSPDATKAQFEALSKMSRDRIMAMFRVHPKLLGISSSEGTDKAQDAQRVFDFNTLQPFFQVMSKRISRALAQAYDVDFVIDHRYRLPKEEQIKLAGEFAALPGVTVKEVREFADLAPTGDSEIDDLVLNLPGEEGLPGDTRNGIPDRNLPGEAGRPPNPVNTRTIGQVGQGVRTVSEARVRSRRPSEKAMDDILAELAALPEGKAARSETAHETTTIIAPSDPFGTRRDDEINAIMTDLEAELQDAGRNLERDLLDHVEGKAFNSKNLRSRVRRSVAWATFTERVEAALTNAIKRGLSRAAVMWGGAGRTPEDDLDYDAIAKELLHRKDGLRSIIGTQRDRVSKKLGEAIEAGGGRDESEAAVRDAIKVWIDTQAGLIADSEATIAFNEGTLSVAELTGATDVYVFEEEDAPDEPCQQARGSVWSIEKARENRIEHPRCRRNFVPLGVVPS
jgi:HK97 family phage portal protein